MRQDQQQPTLTVVFSSISPSFNSYTTSSDESLVKGIKDMRGHRQEKERPPLPPVRQSLVVRSLRQRCDLSVKESGSGHSIFVTLSEGGDTERRRRLPSGGELQFVVD
ncbi:unnamed protein product [Linum trigynum]|uniref:Uncharacterized protein n=1 Tax=Linum trigynum TaxID=586398 RepID=A0AAV2GCG5_9ROSI